MKRELRKTWRVVALFALGWVPGVHVAEAQDLARVSGELTNATAVAASDRRARRKPSKPDVRTAVPGEGVTLDQIEAVFFEQTQRTMMSGLGNSYISRSTSTHLLLKDGTVCDYDHRFPPEDFDVARSRALEPDEWGKWERRGRDYHLVWDKDGDSDVLEGDGWPHQAILSFPADHRLTATYSKTDVGMSGLITDSFLTLRPDGTFKSSSSAALAGAIPSTGSSAATTDGDVTVTGGSPTGQSTVGVAPTRRTEPGTYDLRGYALTLNLLDGSQRRIFVGVPQAYEVSAPDFILMGSSLRAAEGRRK